MDYEQLLHFTLFILKLYQCLAIFTGWVELDFVLRLLLCEPYCAIFLQPMVVGVGEASVLVVLTGWETVGSSLTSYPLDCTKSDLALIIFNNSVTCHNAYYMTKKERMVLIFSSNNTWHFTKNWNCEWCFSWTFLLVVVSRQSGDAEHMVNLLLRLRF